MWNKFVAIKVLSLDVVVGLLEVRCDQILSKEVSIKDCLVNINTAELLPKSKDAIVNDKSYTKFIKHELIGLSGLKLFV